MSAKYVYTFGDGKAEGKADMKNLLGGKGANLAEMNNIGVPVPAGFTITTEMCTVYYKMERNYPPELKSQIQVAMANVETSMGAIFWLPVVRASFSAFRSWAGDHAYNIYGASAHGEKDYRQVNYNRPAVLLMGPEREGLNTEQIGVCTSLVRLPMYGRATSLNLAVATGVLLYAMIA